MRSVLLLLCACDGLFGIRKFDSVPGTSLDASLDARSTYQSIILGDHPVAYFTLDDPEGAVTTVDAVGGYTARVSGLATSGAEPPFRAANHAYAFNGINASVELGDVLSFAGNQPFSLEAWVLNGHDTKFDYAIISKWRQPGSEPPSGWILYYQEGDDLIPTFRIQRQDAQGAGASANATAAEAGAQWHYVVGTFQGSELRIYLDGVFVSFHSSTEVVEHLTIPLEIGAQNGNSHDKPLNGSLDEVAIYDYALADIDISRHYAARSLSAK